MSVSLRPPLVLISIDRRAKMGALLHEGMRFGVSVLEAKQTGLSDRFAGRIADELPEATFEIVHETPLVEGALAHLVADQVADQRIEPAVRRFELIAMGAADMKETLR